MTLIKQKQLNTNIGQHTAFFCILIVSTLLGPLVYLEVASLYHFVIMGLGVLLLCKGFSIEDYDLTIMKFLGIWLLEALFSCFWAPDKPIALRHVYYIFLIFGVCLLICTYITKENLITCFRVLIFILLICNIIAIWETISGHHLQKDYLDSALRLRLLEFMPGTFYRNPNDSATNMIQLLPFSFAGIFDKKSYIRIISIINLILSFYSVCAAQSRTQVIIIIMMFIFFSLLMKKGALLGILVGAAALLLVFSLIFPDLGVIVTDAIESIATDEIQNSAEVGSLHTRTNLFRNGIFMLIDYFGLGVGAGCHRALMPAYAAEHYYTGGITVMHNLFGEILVDYGIFIAIAFIITIIVTCSNLLKIYRKGESMEMKIASLMLFFSTATFILCGVSSSSILQLTSLWMTFGIVAAIIKINKDNQKRES